MGVDKQGDFGQWVIGEFPPLPWYQRGLSSAAMISLIAAILVCSLGHWRGLTWIVLAALLALMDGVRSG